MSSGGTFPKIDARGLLFAAAAACFTAAVAVGMAAARLPSTGLPSRVPAPPATSPVAPAPVLSHPSGDAPASARAPSAKASAEAEIFAREQELFSRAEALREAGKPQEAEAIYLVLLSQGRRRDEAAWKLGDLYMRAKSYRRAKEMYSESARILREKSN